MALASTKLDGGIALVTGAASGIGKEVAFAFAKAGVHGIVLVDRQEPDVTTLEECRKFAHYADLRLLAITADISVEKDVENMAQTAIQEFGRIDYCVHSAGVPSGSSAPTAQLDVEVFDRTMAVNSRGTMLVVRAISEVMAKQDPRTYTSARSKTVRSLGKGAIVVIASINGVIAAPGMMPYTASKYAAIGIAKTAAVDNFQHNIRVNVVCPSWTDTPMLQGTVERVPILDKVIQTMCPLKRAAVPEEVADASVFLCSPAATFINGESLVIDAGFSLTAYRNSL